MPTTMCMSDIVAAINLSEMNSDDTISMDFTTFFQVCRNDNHKASQFQ